VVLNFRSARDIPGNFIHLLESGVRGESALNYPLRKFCLIQRLLKVVVIAAQGQIIEMVAFCYELLADWRRT
jgi:hypothetical protein